MSQKSWTHKQTSTTSEALVKSQKRATLEAVHQATQVCYRRIVSLYASTVHQYVHQYEYS